MGKGGWGISAWARVGYGWLMGWWGGVWVRLVGVR